MIEKNQERNQTELPEEITCSGNVWPNSAKFRDYLSIPMTISIQPFFSSNNDLDNHCSQPVARCSSCKAFLNKFCQILQKNKFQCSICGCINHSIMPINPKSKQLTLNSFICPAPQSVQTLNQQQQPILIFILDISTHFYYDGTFAIYSIRLLKQFLTSKAQKLSEQNTKQEDIRVLLITFDDYVHQYQFKQQGLTRIINTYLTVANVHERKLLHDPHRNVDTYAPKLSLKHADIIDLLDKLQEQIQQNLSDLAVKAVNKSTALLDAIELALLISVRLSGKLYLISTIEAPLQSFMLKKFSFDQKASFQLNKTQCIPSRLLILLNKTRISISIFICNQSYINMLPLHVITKITNGQLRRYSMKQKKEFFYQLKYQLNQQFDNLKKQGIMRVRYSTGLKFLDIFGNYRKSTIHDQIELLSCPENRQYLLEFIVEGKIMQPYVLIQFSVIYIEGGKRWFKIMTSKHKLSQKIQQVLTGLDYINISVAFLKGITHNLDSRQKKKNLLLALQQRCRSHLKVLLDNFNKTQQNQRQIQQNRELNEQNPSQSLIGHVEQQQNKKLFIENELSKQRSEAFHNTLCYKNAQPYIMMTFFLLRHPLLVSDNLPGVSNDRIIQLRNKIATMQDSINKVWPVYYGISENDYEIIQPIKRKFEQKGKLCVLSDFGDKCYVLFQSKQYFEEFRYLSSDQLFEKFKQGGQKFAKLTELIEELSKEKQNGYLPVYLVQYINDFILLDEQGPYGYANFVANLIEETNKQNNPQK